MIILHQFEISPFCDKVRRILHVKRVPYECDEVPPSRDASRTCGKRQPASASCPRIDDDGRIVADSTDIAYYLEERYPEPPLLPDDPRERALVPRARGLGRREPLLLRDAAALHLAAQRAALDAGADQVRPRAGPARRAVGWCRSCCGARSQVQGIGRSRPRCVVRDVERHLDAVDGLVGDGEWLVGDRAHARRHRGLRAALLHPRRATRARRSSARTRGRGVDGARRRRDAAARVT